MRFALNGGVWLHRHKIDGEPMVHLVSSDGIRVPAWHWDVWGEKLRLLDPT